MRIGSMDDESIEKGRIGFLFDFAERDARYFAQEEVAAGFFDIERFFEIRRQPMHEQLRRVVERSFWSVCDAPHDKCAGVVVAQWFDVE